VVYRRALLTSNKINKTSWQVSAGLGALLTKQALEKMQKSSVSSLPVLKSSHGSLDNFLGRPGKTTR